ncbi:MAG: hypothetical protein NC433_02980 [Clostridiales bacterium]|nr:hypothetical protein [Clostridiales bacterium]
MIITSEGKVKVLAKNSQLGRDGKTTYYNLAVLVNGEAGNISCTEEAFNNAVEDTINAITFVYNDQYKYFRIQNACEASLAAKPATQDKPAGKQ